MFRPLSPIALILLAGCHAATGGGYPLPIADALDHLAHADTAGFIKAQHCGIPIRIVTEAQTSAIRWSVTSEGEEAASFTATLTPAAGNTTAAAITVPADPAGGEIYDGGKHYDRPAIQQPLRPAVQELIDAALASRPFDATRIAGDRALDGLCSIQRNAADGGNGHFSIHDPSAGSAGKISTSNEAASDNAATAPYTAPMMTPEQEANNPDAGREGR